MADLSCRQSSLLLNAVQHAENLLHVAKHVAKRLEREVEKELKKEEKRLAKEAEKEAKRVAREEEKERKKEEKRLAREAEKARKKEERRLAKEEHKKEGDDLVHVNKMPLEQEEVPLVKPTTKKKTPTKSKKTTQEEVPLDKPTTTKKKKTSTKAATKKKPAAKKQTLKDQIAQMMMEDEQAVLSPTTQMLIDEQEKIKLDRRMQHEKDVAEGKVKAGPKDQLDLGKVMAMVGNDPTKEQKTEMRKMEKLTQQRFGVKRGDPRYRSRLEYILTLNDKEDLLALNWPWL